VAEGETPRLDKIESVQVFQQNDIDVLTKSADLLARYSKLLLALASSDAADSISGRVSVIGKNMSDSQSGSDAIVVDNAEVKRARAACGVLSKIASEASKWIIQYHINKTLDKVIIDSNPSF